MNPVAHTSLASFVIIPARLASTRLPRKLLLRETGKSLIQHTYEAALRAKKPAGVCVAADHEEIAEEVRRFGGHGELTDPRVSTGTDRVAEVARRLPEVDVVVNLQGDEPEIAGESIDLAIRLLEDDPAAVMSTLATPIRSRKQIDDPACVKVLVDTAGRALDFSRSSIPRAGQQDDPRFFHDPPRCCQHIGLYAYRRDFLLQLTQWPRSDRECQEDLEQLRVLSAGIPVLVGVVADAMAGIDTHDDYREFVRRYAEHQRAEAANETHENRMLPGT